MNYYLGFLNGIAGFLKAAMFFSFTFIWLLRMIRLNSVPWIFRITKRDPGRALGLILVALFFGMVPIARAQVPGTTPYQPNFYRSDTNACPIVLTNGGATTFAGDSTQSLEMTLRQNTGLGIFVTIVSTNAASRGVPLGWDFSYNGNITNGTTTQPLQWTPPANFVGTNTYFTNIDRAWLNNFRTYQLTTASNQIDGTAGAAGSNTNTVTVQKIVYSYANQ